MSEIFSIGPTILHTFSFSSFLDTLCPPPIVRSFVCSLHLSKVQSLTTTYLSFESVVSSHWD